MAKKGYDKEKHKAIVRAATRLFLKHGFSKTSMDAIAAEAGVTKQTIYSHFSNKDALFSEMITAQCTKHTPDERLLHDGTASVDERLFRIGLGFLRMITSNEGLATTRLVMSEAERRPKLAQLFYETGPREMNRILTQFLEEQNAKGALHIPNTASAASYFFSMLKGRYHLRMALKIKPLPTREQIEAHVRETVRIFMKIYDGEYPLLSHDVLT